MFKLLNAAKRRVGAGALVLVSAVAAPAFAVGPASPDLTSLVPDFSTVTTAMVAIGGAVAVVYVTWKGIKLALRAVKGG